jgi:hypothetical protein
LEYGDSPLVQIRAIQARPHRHGQEQGLDSIKVEVVQGDLQ